MNSPQISRERWIANLLDAAQLISDREHQQTRWLADDALAWETPDEAINILYDSVLDGFMKQFAESFTPAQTKAVTEFRHEVNEFCKNTPQHLEAKRVLADPAWDAVRKKASDFIRAFKDKWPSNTT